MSKIDLDKYYTSPELAKYVVDKTKEVIGEENITEYLEPSAGAGVFLNYLDKPYLAYDIEPEDSRITKQDYLELDLEYKVGRVVISNPPFGEHNKLSVKFFKKSVHICDYIAFILPISQYNNTQTMYEFDLIYSEDLGVMNYSNVKIHCAFNIYKKTAEGFNKPISYKLEDVAIFRVRRGSKDVIPKNYDFTMCTWGNGSCGKIPEYQGQYAQEHFILINNIQYKEEVLNLCKNTDWRNLYPSVSSAKLETWKIYKHIRDNIPDIK